MRIAAALLALLLCGGVARADVPVPAFEIGWNLGEGRAFGASHLQTGADLGAGLRWRRLSLLATAQLNTYVVTTTTPGVQAYGFGGRARYDFLLSSTPAAHRSHMNEERTLYVDAGIGRQYLHPGEGPDTERGIASLGTGVALTFVDRRPRTVRIGWYLGVRATFARGLPAIETGDTAALRVGPPAPVTADERSYLVTIGWRFL